MKSKILSAIVICFIFSGSLGAIHVNSDNEVGNILDAAEGLFKAMKDRSYNKIWDSITAQSRATIIEDVIRALEKSGKESVDNQQIVADFNNCETLCKAYWNSYLEHFSPVAVLEQSKWDIGVIKRDKTEIIVTYKRSERPAVIKMYKEDGTWKVGLTETFWSRK